MQLCSNFLCHLTALDLAAMKSPAFRYAITLFGNAKAWLDFNTTILPLYIWNVIVVWLTASFFRVVL
ncbi:hypothetical protein P3S67_010725 [Capsicum chacoense]